MSDTPLFDEVIEAGRPVEVPIPQLSAPAPAIEVGDGYDPSVPGPTSVCGYDVDRTGDDWPGEQAPILAPEDKGA